MTDGEPHTRRVFMETLAMTSVGALAVAVTPTAGVTADNSVAAGGPRPTMVGSYGSWLSDSVLGEKPAAMSFRTGRWPSVDAWRTAARKRTWECIAPVHQGGLPEVRVEAQREFDGLHIEHLSWQLPYGPRTEAVLLKPAKAAGRFPAILALHDHGGNKFLGWRKIARTGEAPWAVQVRHQDRSYEPTSFIASTALGLIRPEGWEPALNASTLPPPWMRANAWAI